MSIQFNRNSVQQFWQHKGQSSTGPLSDALADDQLSKAEYEQLKTQFAAEHPGQDFDRWLADALDGQLDQKSNAQLLSAIRSLGQNGSAVASVSFAAFEGPGYQESAQHYAIPAFFDAVKAADGNNNGRIDAAELRQLQGRLPADLMQQLRADGAVLTFDNARKSLSFYPAPEAPILHGRYKDLRVDLDLDLKDIDGIADRSRSDLQGQASGELHFDWRGPLVNGLRQALQESTGGWVDLNARYAGAGESYGPGYVIQAQSGPLATRPIVIKHDGQGQLYLESPGFGETARLWLGEKGLNKYALPQLREMGLDLQLEKKDGRIYLHPQQLRLNDLPLSAQGESGGALQLELKGRTRFNVAADGLRARFDQVQARGSSQASGRQAVADSNAQGVAAPDRLRGKVQAGLNYNVQRQELDAQVLLQGVEAEVNLSADEAGKLPYLTPELRELAGQELQARLRLSGAYRNVNGVSREGRVQGQLDLSRRQGEERTDVHARFQSTPLSQRPGQRLSSTVHLSAVDVRHQRKDEDVRVSARSASITARPQAAPKVELTRASVRAEVSGPLLERAKVLLNEARPGAAQVRDSFKALGISDAQLQILTQGSAAQLRELMSAQTFVQQLEKAVLQLDAERVQIDTDATGQLRIQADRLQAEGQAEGRNTRMDIQASARQASASGRQLELSQSQLQAELQRTTAGGRVDGQLRLDSEQVALDAADPRALQASLSNSQLQSDVQARTTGGKSLRLGLDTDNMQLTGQPGELTLDAESASVRGHYQSREGTDITLQAESGPLQLYQTAPGQWQLNVPDLRTQMSLDLAVQELRQISSRLGPQAAETLDQLARAETPAAFESALRAVGLEAVPAREASQLLWRPELRALFASSEFVSALQSGERIQVGLQSSGDLQLQQAEQLRASAHAEVQAQGSLNNTAGDALISAQAETNLRLQTDGQRHRAEADSLTLQAQAVRADGSRFADLQLRSQQLAAELMPDGSQQLRVGETTAQLSASTHLDAERMVQIQSLLSDFRDTVVERLAALGLSRQQFEQVLQAFGQRQLDALLKSATPEALANVSESLGLSPEQIEKTLGLLNDEPFQRAVQDIFAFSRMLDDASLDIQLQGSMGAASWQRQDQQMLLQLQQLSASLQAQTQNASGQGDFSARLQQEAITYTQSPDAQRLSWEPVQAEAEATPRGNAADAPDEALTVWARLEGGAGELVQEQGLVRSEIARARLSGELQQQSETGRQAELSGSLTLEQVNTRRSLGEPDSARLEVQGLAAEARGSLQDPEDRQDFSASGELSMQQIDVNPRGAQVSETELSARLQTRRDLSQNQQGEAEAALNLQAADIRSSEADGVQMAEAHFDGHAASELKENDQVRTRLRVEAQDGTLSNLQAREGQVSLDQMRTEIRGQVQTPLVRGELGGQMQVDGFLAVDGEEARAQGFQVDALAGKLHLDSTRLRDIISGNPDALAILETVSEKWAARQRDQAVPNIFLNPAITLDIDQGHWRGDASDGNALAEGQTLSARMRFPDLDTQLGQGSIELQLNNLTLPGAAQRPQVELTGTARLQPRQPEFNQSVQSLVERSLKGAGVNLKPEVSFENGRFEVKIDRWYADGLIKVDFEGDQIQLSVDRAKLLGFLSARGLATRFSEGKLNDYLLDIDRQGNQLTLSLNEFSERLLHRDNLQIQSVNTRSDNSIEMQFAYTDTKAYNAGFRQRQQDKLEQRLFSDPVSGQARTAGQVESVIEGLEAGRLALIMQQASPNQLRRMLSTVGNDYDNLVREALQKQPDLQRYPLQNRAIMAVTLADNKGFLERVDSSEKNLIRRILDSVPADQQARFEATLTDAERQRLHAALGTRPASPRRVQPPHRR
ncbi:MAG: hypothetical protein IGS03_17060 [Candidatus Sericytochromatia bacterium]|nr:hypothetical protein [Candidatus Sericytochromatia bacterium]